MKTTHIAVCAVIAAAALAFTACDTGSHDTELNPPHSHNWGDWGATTIEGTEQRVCKSDSSHIQHRLTGTDRFTFTSATSTSYRVKKGTVTSGAVVIPAYYRPDTSGDHLTDRGYLPVTEIGSESDSAYSYPHDGGAFSSTGITAVNIPDTITSIGGYAFAVCTSLAGVTIPTSVTFIGNRAFSNCISLTSITIPSSVTEIGYRAFENWDDDQVISVPFDDEEAADKVWGTNWRNGSDAIIMGKVDNGTPGLAFELINNDTAYRVRKGTVTKGEVRIPAYYRPNADSQYKPVREIDDGAFQETNITAVIIPASVTTIGSHAFAYCHYLTSVTIPASVTEIGLRAFQGCTSLASITVVANNPNYASQDGILYNKAKTSILLVPEGISGNVTIPAGVTEIGDYAFEYCSRLTSITIPAGVTSIGVMAFSGCTSLTSINIPAGVTEIGYGAFHGCTSLTSITIPAGVTVIGYNAFSNCTRLASITIPASVTEIGGEAFSGWTSSQKITVQGKTDYGATVIAGWNYMWKDGCNAQIIYSGG